MKQMEKQIEYSNFWRTCIYFELRCSNFILIYLLVILSMVINNWFLPLRGIRFTSVFSYIFIYCDMSGLFIERGEL